jgi:serine/threonine-protein kinase
MNSYNRGSVALAQGTRLGPYQIAALIGAGGMGEVYRAVDTNLSRDVAIKVLPESVAADADRLARFDREARTLAALNHPNIAVIYGVERAGGITGLVMELVEGFTLAERIAEGPIPIDETLLVAKQIAEALEAAHEQGIIHRDLKPANIKLRSDGRVKVLDFGLAKAIDGSGLRVSGGVSQSPTITTPAMTQAGVILGTAAYMSPEQARGRTVDRRADIWAFGCVLFEMLAERRVFQNDEVSDTLAFVLTKEPDWGALPTDTPPAILRLLRRCLVKDRSARLPDIGSARLEIDEARTELTSPRRESPVLPPRGRRWVPALVSGVAIIVAIAAIAGWMNSRRLPMDRQVARVLIDVAPADRLLSGMRQDASTGQGRPSRTVMAFAPDGRSIVFSAERDGQVKLYVRRLDQLEATPLQGTEEAMNPFFSPSGDEVGFYTRGALKKLPVAGGPVVTLCEVDQPFGASWGVNGQILFGPLRGGLQSVAASGGKPSPVTKLEEGEFSHRLPQLLPDGETVLFTATRSGFPTWEDTYVIAQSLKTGERKVLIEGGADARYVSTGHLLYLKAGTLMAVPFDLSRLEVTGASVGLVANVMQAARVQPVQIDSGAGQFAVSDSGSLAYVTGGVFTQDRWSLVWVDRAGKVEPLNLPSGAYLAPRLSPDGKRIAFATSTGDWDIWTYEISRGVATRLSMEGEQSIPVWTPDGARLIFTSGFTGTRGGALFARNADGSGTPERLATTVSGYANAWTSDGTLIFSSDGDLWRWSGVDKREPQPLVSSPAQEIAAELSSDGEWLAYNGGSLDAQSNRIYVQRYPALDLREAVAGGTGAKWREDGRELYFVQSASGEGPLKIRVMAVPITTRPTLTIGSPRELFEGPFRIDGPFRGYDVTPDGQRFLMVRAVEQPPTRVTHMVLVQNWIEELKARVPVK